MRSIKIITPVLLPAFLSISLCFTIFSCNNNPVTPVGADSTIDSARYNWRTYPVSSNSQPAGGVYSNPGIWIRDSNDFIIYGNLHFSSGNFTTITNDNFQIAGTGGFGKDLGYIIGYDHTWDSTIEVRKWNGNTFSNVSVANNRIVDYPISCLFNNPNEIWIVTNSKNIYKYDGRGLTKYTIPFPDNNNCSLQRIFIDSASKKLGAVIWTNTNIEIGDLYREYSVFELAGNTWNRSGTFELSAYRTPDIFDTDGYLLTKIDNHISSFNGNSFTEIINSKTFTIDQVVAMISPQNALIFGYTSDGNFHNNYALYNCNNGRWSKEYRIEHGFYSVWAINRTTYLSFGWDYLAIGTKK